MKKIGLILATMFCLALFTNSVSAQTTYTWNQTGTAAWTTDTNWTPTRTTPANDDVLVFNNGATTTVTAVPTQTIGQLSVSGNTSVTLQAAAAVTLTIAGGTGTDLSVAAGSTLSCNVANGITISVATGATGSIGGSVSLSNAAHRLLAADASGITFNSGSTFTEGTAFSGNPFGTTSLNSVVFASGSTFIFIAGSNPFGAGQPSSCVVFQSGSLFSSQGTAAPAFSGRTYANFELNNGSAVVSATGGAAVSINDLTITAGTFNFGMTGTPGHSIKGNISVASGATLNFNPATTSTPTLNLNGTSAQTISGAGTITLNDADQTIVINNANGITLARNLTFTLGALTLTSGNISAGSNTLTIASGATVNRTSGHVIGNLQKGYAATGTKLFEVGTANGYSPVSVNITAGTFPTDFTVRAVQGPQPNVVSPASALQRYWKLAATGVTANLVFNYLDIDVPPPPATENSFVIFKWDGGFTQPGGSVDTGMNTASISGVSDATLLSDWTLAQPNAPTAGNATISGRIVTSNGTPVEGAVVYLSGNQNRKFITDALGFYQFDNVETSGFYTVTPQRANFGFSPGAQSFTQLSSRTEAIFTAVPVGTSTNPLDTPEYFVRQHYLDFLGREPDEAGFNFWSDQILACGNDAACIERRTINVSAAYFRSIEFQDTGGLVDRLYRASYGRNPLYAEFLPDTATIARNVQVGKDGWDATLAANREAFIANWVERAAFRAAFDSLTDDAYVGALISNTNASFTQAERDSLVSGLGAGTLSRAAVLQQIVNNENFARARFNEAFVMMEYFGYLRRDPDAPGLSFWLNKLNEFEGNFERAEMVKAFINSGEYRSRFVR